MLGFLSSLLAAIMAIITTISYVFDLCVKWLPTILNWAIIVIGSVRANIPQSLATVCVICITVVIGRFVYNAVRGSGA